MTKFNEFFESNNPKQDLEKMQKINGVYGCQSCNKESYLAYFNEGTGEMMWFCDEGHKSSFTVQ